MKLADPPSGRHGWPWDVPPASVPSLMPDGSPWPLVSIITPSFNQAEFLEETIRSILLQGYPNLEYIIMDGGSTDGSVKIIEKYSPWLTYWVSQKDDGQSSAINSGFQKANGQYVAWLNSDDVFMPGAIQRVVEALHHHPNVGMAFGQTDVIDEQSQRIGAFEPVDYRFDDLLCMKIILPQQVAFFRKSIFETLGYLRSDLDYAMDVEFFIRIGALYDILPVRETLGQFRLSTSNKGVVAKSNWCPEFIKIIDDFFVSQEMFQKYGHLRPAAYGGAYYRGAHIYLEIGQYTRALSWLIQAAKYHGMYYLKPGWWKACLLSLLGRPGAWIFNTVLVWMQKNKLYVNEQNWQVGLAIKGKNNH